MRGLAVALAITACGGSSATPGDGPKVEEDGSPDAPPNPCAPETWCIEDAPSAALNLRSVWAADLNNVFAVGAGGTILHRRDNAWTAMASGTIKDLQGVWGISASDVWAAGNDGTVLHFDGSQWSPRGSFTQDFNQLWASGTDDVWFTAGTSVVHWDGQQFSSTSFAGTVYSISGTGPDDIWVTGENAKVAHYTDGTWQTGIETGGTATNFGILALPGETWVSGFKAASSTTFHFASGSWSEEPVSAGTTFRAFHGVSASDIWGAGGNDVGRYDGAAWSIESPAGAGASLLGIGGIGRSFWIVGSDSLILHRR